MADLTHRIDTKTITLTLTMPRMFGFRMWMTRKLLQLAGIVSPITIEAEWRD